MTLWSLSEKRIPTQNISEIWTQRELKRCISISNISLTCHKSSVSLINWNKTCHILRCFVRTSSKVTKQQQFCFYFLANLWYMNQQNARIVTWQHSLQQISACPDGNGQGINLWALMELHSGWCLIQRLEEGQVRIQMLESMARLKMDGPKSR